MWLLILENESTIIVNLKKIEGIIFKLNSRLKDAPCFKELHNVRV